MKKSSRRSLAAVLLPCVSLAAVSACSGIAKQLGAAKNFADCQFRLHSVRDVSFQGVAADQLSGLGALGVARLGSAFSEESLWLRFTLNIEVRNPNPVPASMNRVEWMLFLDDVQMLHGTLANRVDLPPGPVSVAQFPVDMQIDLKRVFSRDSLSGLINLAVNFAGMGDRPTRLMAKVRPTIQIAGITYEFDNFIDVKTEYASRPRVAPNPAPAPSDVPASI